MPAMTTQEMIDEANKRAQTEFDALTIADMKEWYDRCEAHANEQDDETVASKLPDDVGDDEYMAAMSKAYDFVIKEKIAMNYYDMVRTECEIAEFTAGAEIGDTFANASDEAKRVFYAGLSDADMLAVVHAYFKRALTVRSQYGDRLPNSAVHMRIQAKGYVSDDIPVVCFASVQDSYGSNSVERDDLLESMHVTCARHCEDEVAKPRALLPKFTGV